MRILVSDDKPKGINWRRHALGICGLGSLIVYVSLLATSGESSERQMMFASICMRLGVVFCATWLAFDQASNLVRSMPRWCWVLLGLAIGLFVANPRLFPYSFVLLALVGMNRFVAWLKKPPR